MKRVQSTQNTVFLGFWEPSFFFSNGLFIHCWVPQKGQLGLFNLWSLSILKFKVFWKLQTIIQDHAEVKRLNFLHTVQ